MNRSTIMIGALLVGAPFVHAACSAQQPPGDPRGITAVEGLELGHYTLDERPTGCTVILARDGAVGGVDVRGGAPGTREIGLLDPVNMVERVNAVVLSGGSAFGLDVSTGVMDYLEDEGHGFAVGRGKVVPIVVQAILFDLGLEGQTPVRPDADCGRRAARAASTAGPAEGTVGAGAGATVGKMGGGSPMKGGFGTAHVTLQSGLTVAAAVAVNSVGDIIDPATGEVVAGMLDENGGFVDARRFLRASARQGAEVPEEAGANTTIGLVATNATLTKAQATKIAQMAQDGFARAIYPAHTMGDGDTVFSLATGAWNGEANVTLIGALAADVMAEAILRAVRLAEGVPGYRSVSEISR